MKDTKPSVIGDVVTPIDWDAAPTDEWKCEICGSVNRNWLPTIAAIFGGDGPAWRPGVCGVCEERAKALERQEREENERRQRYNRILSLHSQAALPKELAYVKFSGLKRVRGMEEAFDELENLDISQDRTWLCLYGDNNTGKSRLLAATSNRQNALLVPTLYINESLFFKQVKESWESNDESKVMGVFQLAELVLWDEFLFFDYLERGWIYERVYALLEYLAEMDKKVIFATNILNIRKKPDVEVDQFSIEGRCGKRIWARLQRRNTRYIKMRNQPFF